MLDSIYVVFSSRFQLSVPQRIVRAMYNSAGTKQRQKTPGRVGSLIKLKSFILTAF